MEAEGFNMGKQLLYMYIDEFYGFKKQGFNFSTDVEFKVYYQEELLIMQKMDCDNALWEGFWGKNISDISVLVGDNGSGKTTLMKIICQWLCCFSQGRLPQEKGILVFRENSSIGYRYIAFEKGDKLELSVNIPEAKVYTTSELVDFTKDLRLIYFSNTMTELNLDNEILLDCSLTHRIIGANVGGHFSHENIIVNYNRKEFRKQVDTALNGKVVDFPVHYLRMEIRHLEFDTIQRQQKGGIKEIALDLTNLWEHYFGKNESNVSEEKFPKIELLKALLIGVIKYILQYNHDVSAAVANLEELVKFYKSNIMEEGVESGVEFFKQFLTDFVLDSNCNRDKLEMKESIVQFISLLQSDAKDADIPFLGQWRHNPGKEGVSIGQINIESDNNNNNNDNRKKFKKFWEAYKKVDDYVEKVSFFWDASSGERNWVSLFSELTNVQGENIWLFLDEPDNTLHPEWQRTVLEKIIEVCNGANYSGKRVQLWITTHSPIMLSDMPGNSVIYLKNKKNMDCQMKETFGQNIYALFNHAFFLHDGVIGAFASKKILEVVKKQQNIEKRLLEKNIAPETIEQIHSELAYCEKLADLLAEPLYKRQIKDSIVKFKRLVEAKASGRKIYD